MWSFGSRPKCGRKNQRKSVQNTLDSDYRLKEEWEENIRGAPKLGVSKDLRRVVSPRKTLVWKRQKESGV